MPYQLQLICINGTSQLPNPPIKIGITCFSQGGILVEGEGSGSNEEEDAKANADANYWSRSEPHEDDPAKGEDAGKEKSK